MLLYEHIDDKDTWLSHGHTDITNQGYCHQCDKIYLIKSDIQVHTDITNQDYCHQCDKIYLTKSDIQVHTDISHQDYCHIGDTSYKTNFNMIHSSCWQSERARCKIAFPSLLHTAYQWGGCNCWCRPSPVLNSRLRLGSKQPAEAKHFIVDPATKDTNI